MTQVTPSPPNPSDRILAVRNLSKTFSGNKVLKHVTFDVLPGEIHALVGENGSGKSTFIKCIAGFHQPDDGGEISIGGQRLSLPYGPADALRYGMGFVHQNLGLIPTLSVSDNLGLYRRFGTSVLGAVSWREQRALTQRALAGFGAHINPDTRVGDLPQADKTLVAIARGLASAGPERKLLVLDEPTAALPAEEVDRLLAALRKLAARGVSLIYVSHRLPEVLSLADRVTALRDGQVVGTRARRDLDEQGLVDMIIGRSLEAYSPRVMKPTSVQPLFEIEALQGKRVRNLSLTIRRGEIVGVAGLLGSGRSELGRMIFGAQKKAGGVMRLSGQEIRVDSPVDGLAHGIAYIPEDRLGKGGIGAMSVMENLTLPHLAQFWIGGRLRRKSERRTAYDLIRKFRISPADPDARFSSLSGGNQQKAIIARSLHMNPRLVILDEPAQGVDIGSKVDIFAIIRDTASQGAGILVIDADFQDLCALCDRVLVLKDGRLVSELSGDERTPARIANVALMSSRECV